MKTIIIAIDGPAGAGKSVTSRRVAEQLGYIYIDTGAMYRAVTLECLNNNLDITDESMLNLMNNIHIKLMPSDTGQRTFLNGKDVSSDIRSQEVTKLVSPVSANRVVREKLVDMQRALGADGGVVMDGRDIGTVVFPNANLKIFMTASIKARAERRTLEIRNSGLVADIDEIEKQIENRDKYDSSREISPLRKADDAIEIDTSDITIEEQVRTIVELAKIKINQ